MSELLKKWLILLVKTHEIKRIDKECDRYFKIKAKLEVQRQFINELIDGFEKTYGENLRTPKERGGEK